MNGDEEALAAFRASYLQDIRGSAGGELAGRKIVLGLSGSIAAVEAPHLARALMRQGADVWVCMTPSAATMVTPTAMQWCTGNPVMTELGGWVEHLFLAGDWEGRADLLLVAPATANTVAKMALGIDDTVVTTVATTAIGARLPVMVAPGMHAVMAEHPAFVENLRRLQSFGVEVIGPRAAERKAKMATVEEIVAAVCARLQRPRGGLAGRRVLITAGPTVEFLDPVRVVTNLSSGRQGIALVREAARRGAHVTLVYGPGSEPPPPGVEVRHVLTSAEMLAAVREVLEAQDVDVSVFAAAVSDFAPQAAQSAKVPTADGTPWRIDLLPTPKILETARALTRGRVVSFKAEATDSDDTLRDVARAHQRRSGADLTVANRVGRGRGFMEATNEVYLLSADGREEHVPMSDKRVVAGRVWDAVEAMLAR